MSLDKSAIEKLEQLVREGDCRVVDIDGHRYTERPLHQVSYEKPGVKPLVVSTLDAFETYVKADPDLLGREDGPLLVHVIGPAEVALRSKIQEDDVNTRHVYVTSKCAPAAAGFQYGQQLDRETFSIALRTLFAQTADRDTLVSLISSITDESTVKTEDDGITQSVTAKVGIVGKAQVPVSNPVVLAPFRTFPDIEPVASPFIFRMAGGNGRPVTCSLHDADRGLWVIETMKRIAEHISAGIGDSKVLILK